VIRHGWILLGPFPARTSRELTAETIVNRRQPAAPARPSSSCKRQFSPLIALQLYRLLKKLPTAGSNLEERRFSAALVFKINAGFSPRSPFSPRRRFFQETLAPRPPGEFFSKLSSP